MYMLTFACYKILGCLKININSDLDRYKAFTNRQRIYTAPGSEQYFGSVLVLGFEVVQIESVLV